MMPTMVLLVSVLTIWIPKIFLFNTFSYLEIEKKSGVEGRGDWGGRKICLTNQISTCVCYFKYPISTDFFGG